MATLFNKQFRYIELKDGHYEHGDYVHGSMTVDKMVHGTIQSATYKEQIPAITGTRNTGNVDIYSSEMLTCRTHGGNDGGYVNFGGKIYQLVSEQYYPHLRGIEHWKYVAEMVPAEEVPQAVTEAFAA